MDWVKYVLIGDQICIRFLDGELRPHASVQLYTLFRARLSTQPAFARLLPVLTCYTCKQ